MPFIFNLVMRIVTSKIVEQIFNTVTRKEKRNEKKQNSGVNIVIDGKTKN